MSQYLHRELRRLGNEMIYLEAATKGAITRGEQLTARELWLRRMQVQDERSRKLRQYVVERREPGR